MSQFEIDVSQVSPLHFNEGAKQIEEQQTAVAAEGQVDQNVETKLDDQSQQKDAAYESGGRNDPEQPTSDDGTLDYLQTTPDEQRAEGVKKTGEEKTRLEATGDIAKGGVMDAAEGFWTLAGRIKDMFTGKADREGETYRPEGMFFDEENNIDYNPITQETSWGKMGRDLVAFGATSAVVGVGVAAVAAAAPAIGIGAGIAGLLSAVGLGVRATRLAAIVGKTSAFLGGTGMIVDAIDMKSADDNMSGTIAKTQFMKEAVNKFPFLVNPIATSDTDSIFTKTWKNVLEAGMMGGILGKTFGFLSSGRSADNAVKGKPTKPPREVTPANSAKEIVDEQWARNKAKADAEAKASAYADLRRDTATKYNNTTKRFFDKLSPEDQDKLLEAQYYKNPDKYAGWSPKGEEAEERAARKLVEMNKSQNDQVTEAGLVQVDIPGMGGYKNKGTITDAQQGNTLSGNRVIEVADQIHTKRNTYNGEYGSVDTLHALRPAAILRANLTEDISTKELEEISMQMLGKERYGSVIKEMEDLGKSPREIFPEAFQAAKELFEGRNTTDLSAEDFWKKFDEEVSFRIGGPNSREGWYYENVVAADIANGMLYSQMRDLALAGREAGAVLDPWDVDGPAQQILEQLEYGLFNVKKSRMMWSQIGRGFQTVEGAERGAKAAEKAMKKKLAAIRRETKNQVELMRQMALKSPSDELSNALLEAFSWSNDIANWEDVAEIFRKKLRGGTFRGKEFYSMALKEIQGTMIHSVLSGPKTAVRAIMGTATAAFLRPMSQVIGGMGTLDKTQVQEGLAALSGAVGAIPDSWKLFKRNLHAYWSGDLSTIKTRFAKVDEREEEWKAMGEWMMEYGSDADKAAYLMGNFARGLNDQSLLTYSTKIMGATDDAFGYIMARSRAKVKAMQDSLEVQNLGKTPEITPELMKEFEDRYMSEFIEPDTGRIKVGSDVALEYAAKEATLTRDLSGFSKGFADLFSKNPWTKPFFLFARTGINGIELTLSHMPVFKYMVTTERRILNATISQANAGDLAELGIKNAADLANAKAIQRGRTIIGGSIISLAAQKVMAGELTGNGSPDRGVRAAQRAGDWQPRSIKIFGKWVSYESFEPFSTVLAYVADTADSMELMGQSWVEDKFQKVAFALVGSGVSKTYLSGLTQIVDLLAGEPGQIEMMAANLVNNTVPFSSLRNEVGKVLNPYMKELNREFGDQVRNRNQITEYLAANPLPVKTDVLNGKPIRNWSLPVRLYNAFSPVPINPDYSPGRSLLFNSGFDSTPITMRPNGIDLSGERDLRADYQNALGQQGIEDKLNRLAENPRAIQDLKDMAEDRASNRFGKEPSDFWVNEQIGRIFNEASQAAWNEVRNSPAARRLVQQKDLLEQSRQLQRLGDRNSSNSRYDQLQELRKLSGVN